MQSRPPRACFLAINDRYDDVQVHIIVCVYILGIFYNSFVDAWLQFFF